MDGARSGARRQAALKIHRTCRCGRVVYGNGKAHQRGCEAHLREAGWPLAEAMRHAIREQGGDARLIAAVERGIGAVYLQRRERGDRTELPWPQLRDLVWRLVADLGDTRPTAATGAHRS